MATDDRDDEATRTAIRELFAKANRPERRPPPFQSLWPGIGGASGRTAPVRLPLRRPLPRFGVPAAVLAGALALVLAVVILQPRAGRDAGAGVTLDPALTGTASWQGPLDFLLRTPGYDFLETVPEPFAPAADPLADLDQILEESSL